MTATLVRGAVHYRDTGAPHAPHAFNSTCARACRRYTFAATFGLRNFLPAGGTGGGAAGSAASRAGGNFRTRHELGLAGPCWVIGHCSVSRQGRPANGWCPGPGCWEQGPHGIGGEPRQVRVWDAAQGGSLLCIQMLRGRPGAQGALLLQLVPRLQRPAHLVLDCWRLQHFQPDLAQVQGQAGCGGHASPPSCRRAQAVHGCSTGQGLLRSVEGPWALCELPVSACSALCRGGASVGWPGLRRDQHQLLKHASLLQARRRTPRGEVKLNFNTTSQPL